MKNNGTGSATYGGIGILGLLQVAFIVLKLVGVINWSWVKVFIPMWIEAGIVGVVLIVAAVLYKMYHD